MTVALQAPAGSPFPIVNPDIYRTVDWVAANQFDTLELHIQKPDMVDGERLKAYCDAKQVGISTIGTGMAYTYEGLTVTDPDPMVRAAALQRLKDQIDLAAVLRCDIVIGSMRGGLHKGDDLDSIDRRMCLAMNDLCDYAEKKQVNICIEALNRYETQYLRTGEDVLGLIESVGSSRLKVHLDSYHMNIEESDMGQAIRRCAKHLGHFHACDNNRRYPGSGHIDFAPLLAALCEIGYPYSVTQEILPTPDGYTAAQRGLEHMRQIYR